MNRECREGPLHRKGIGSISLSQPLRAAGQSLVLSDVSRQWYYLRNGRGSLSREEL